MRGEYLYDRMQWKLAEGSPPLARGILRRYSFFFSFSGITPACAGNTKKNTTLNQQNWDHPRLRGEYVGVTVDDYYIMGSPPLARGILMVAFGASAVFGITPACAGNTRARIKPMNLNRDHPRLRGEYYICVIQIQIYQGSPPLARGILHLCYSNTNLSGITPACAGNTFLERLSILLRWDHPRLRGEYLPVQFHLLVILGSPPLARGILPQKLRS